MDEFVRFLMEELTERFQLQPVTGSLGNFSPENCPAVFLEGKAKHWNEIYNLLVRYFSLPQEITAGEVRCFHWMDRQVALSEVFPTTSFFFLSFRR